MSIDRIHGDVVFTCDNCDDTLETDTDEFAEALGALRREGWRSEKVGVDWVHLCPECRADGGFVSRPEDFA